MIWAWVALWLLAGVSVSAWWALFKLEARLRELERYHMEHPHPGTIVHLDGRVEGSREPYGG